jgi:hypothetical protein
MNSIERMREKEKLLTYEEVKEMFDYDSEKGILIWKTRPINSKYLIGTVAGSLHSTGYVTIRIKKIEYKSHRIIWLLMTGKWPENQIDHINGIRNDNRFCNLREATGSQNNANTPRRINVSGYKGVSKERKKWRARISLNNKPMSIGYYDTPEEAHAAYVAKAKELFGDYAKV